MTGIGCRVVVLVFAAAIALAAADAADAADWQVRPFVGFTFAGDTTFVVDLDHAVGKLHGTFGASVTVLGEVLGVDVDVGHSPGFFQTGESTAAPLVIDSRVTTVTGNVVIATPRRWTEYSLRPYVLGGGGIMRVRAEDYFQVYEITEVLPAVDVGVGVIGFVTKRVGVSWEVRRFQIVGDRNQMSGISVGAERVSFWRATMAVAIRY